MKSDKQGFLDNFFLLLLFSDASLENFAEDIGEHFDESIEKVHVCISERIAPLYRVRFARIIRNMFGFADVRISSVTDEQLKYLVVYTKYYKD